MTTTQKTLENMGVIGPRPVPSVIGRGEPLAHPQNCKTECPYGKGRAFCFPCMAKILSEQKAKKENQKE